MHKSSLVASAEYPTDPEGLSHMGVVVRRAWYKLLSSDARVHLLSGAIAATVSNTIVAPLDVIRLNIMVSETPLSALTVIKQVRAPRSSPTLTCTLTCTLTLILTLALALAQTLTRSTRRTASQASGAATLPTWRAPHPPPPSASTPSPPTRYGLGLGLGLGLWLWLWLGLG